MIKHIVISGGSVYGFVYYGILKSLLQSHTIDIENIQTIYATSVGCIIAVLLSLQLHIEEIDNYLINRPWQNVFEFTLSNILNIIQHNGMFDMTIITTIFTPLFIANDMNIDITMLEFYKKTKMEFHFF
jgi:predicted acylesterase/phospholipase RssA